MTIEYSGASEPDVILPMLWRHVEPSGGDAEAKPQVGRKPRLSIDDVVAAALTIADGQGLAAVSMSRVAASLDVGAMTLYTYVASKAVLIDLMVDQVLGERDLPPPDQERPDGWRAQVALYAERTRSMHRSHSWLRHVSTIRPPIGPGMLAELEYVVSCFAGTGLSPQQMVAAGNALIAFVNTTAGIEADSEQLQRATGQSNDAWWYERSLLWEKYFDAERYPTMTYVLQNDGCHETVEADMTEAHEFGLQRLLDGIQAVIDS